MDSTIRDYLASDEEAVVELSLRAWAPAFASTEAVMGKEIAVRLHGQDWRTFQERSVRAVLANESARVWVGEADGRITGFVAATVADEERLIGEVLMLAVDPSNQRGGVGTALTEFATAYLRDLGMRVALIDTGGDPGHAPARRVYEKADYTLRTIARYFKAL